MSNILKKIFLLSGAITCIAFSTFAWADGNPDVDVLKQLLGTEGGKSSGMVVKPLREDDALRLTSNKDELIRLDQDAASVIVNNPVHASVMLDSPRLLIVMPREPGATSFSVLNAAGEVILHRDIIVTNVQPKYVRVRRICNGGDPSCVPAAYFYCPDGCYEVTPVTGTGSTNIPPPAAPPRSERNEANGASTVAPDVPPPPLAPPAGATPPAEGEENNDTSKLPPTQDQLTGPDGEPATTPGQKP